VASVEQLAGRQVHGCRWLGRDVAVLGAKAPYVVQGHCPHLGAAFAVGGRLEADRLICPFHAWGFDPTTGRLEQIPYSNRPVPKVCLERWPTARVGRSVFAWSVATPSDADEPTSPSPPRLLGFGDPGWRHAGDLVLAGAQPLEQLGRRLAALAGLGARVESFGPGLVGVWFEADGLELGLALAGMPDSAAGIELFIEVVVRVDELAWWLRAGARRRALSEASRRVEAASSTPTHPTPSDERST
jgi:nitrite reductase/ring-hydroxylating ferredoxin subunit